MKKLLFTFIFLLTASLQAQVYYPYSDYIPFPDSDAVWRVGLWGSRCFGPVTYPGVIEYYINGDTIINGLSYVKLYRRTIQKGTLPFYAPQILNGYVGAVRNDTANKTVWLRPLPSIDTGEVKIWDLRNIGNPNPLYNSIATHFPTYTSLPLGAGVTYFSNGDSTWSYGGKNFCFYEPTFSYSLQVTRTNSVFILGKIRRNYRITYNSYFSNGLDFFIEGIGFRKGLLEGESTEGVWDSVWRIGKDSEPSYIQCIEPNNPAQSQLLCFTENGQSYAFVPGGCDAPIPPTPATGTYVPFPGDGAKWRIKINNSIYEYRLSGDTVLQGNTYWKVYRTRVSGYVSPTYLPWQPNGYIGAVRDDAVNRKVWFYPSGDTLERILYDFSIADTGYFVWNYFQSNCHEEVNSVPPTLCPSWISRIDSVQMLGQWRRRWQLERRVSDTSVFAPFYMNYGDTIFYRFSKKHLFALEGLGVLEQPFEFWTEQSAFVGWNNYMTGIGPAVVICGDSLNFQFVCFEWNGQSYIADTAACYQPVGLSFEETAEIKTYFQGERLVVEAMEGIPLQEIKVFNLLGQEIPLEFHSISGDKQEAAAFLLPSGIYIVKVQTAQGIITEKVWKK